MSEKTEKERRRFFRIDDEVALSYRLASEEEAIADEKLQVTTDATLSLATELEKMNERSRIHLRHVEKESPEVARYFSFIESKISFLAQHLMKSTDELFKKTTQPVNISGSGILFNADDPLSAGNFIEIKFILRPSLASIKAFSRVVSCHSEGDLYRVAVEFNRLSDEDRDLLIRHVVKKQMNDIREKSD
ncbi:MAG: pilus assembly protein PilZ [Cycloclasticus sp.]|nr:pilus assembly protein PilZ [Cycloclasticus sp.]MBG96551.1 pilus assembly protein PilZ [Cycloclasticus sp.]HAI96163.1 PilZ domain-containing protein [Methylococcaceae bacterium]|tara:strand:+ start:1951 stop:2520 length:570 start_codon:yes stop_codon:yes gene_type:complete